MHRHQLLGAFLQHLPEERFRSELESFKASERTASVIGSLKVGDSVKLEGISESVRSCKTDVLATAKEAMVEEEEGSCSLSQRREGAKALSGIAEKIWRTYFCSYEPTDYVLHGKDCCIGCVENSWPCCFVYQQVWVF